MTAIVIARVRISDPVRYAVYMPLAKAAIEAFGGKYLVRGATSEVIEGDIAPERYVVVEFESQDTVRRFYDSELYLRARQARSGAAQIDLISLTGVQGA